MVSQISGAFAFRFVGSCSPGIVVHRTLVLRHFQPKVEKNNLGPCLKRVDFGMYFIVTNFDFRTITILLRLIKLYSTCEDHKFTVGFRV